jgi:hypothetical protein
MSAAIALPEGHSDDPIHPGAPNHPQASDMVIPDVLQRGTLMTKVSERAKKRVIFRIDPDEGQILYKSSKGGISPSKFYLQSPPSNMVLYQYRLKLLKRYAPERMLITIARSSNSQKKRRNGGLRLYTFWMEPTRLFTW